MLKEESSGGGNPTGDSWARVCDTCRSSPCAVYCRADAAYLCGACDARLHASSRHERVWVCESCERAPAAFLCKADAASLCADCDAKVHSANPLARRHQRFPILPISGCLYGPTATNLGSRLGATARAMGETDDVFDEEDEDEAASWLLLNPSNNNNKENNNITKGCSLGGEVVDEYLDLVEFDLGGDNARLNDLGGDNARLNEEKHYSQQSHHQCTVPTGAGEDKEMHDHHHTFQMGVDPFAIKSDHFAYNNSLSVGHSVSAVSSMDVGIVPDSTTSDISTSHARSSKGTIELFSSPPIQQMPTQLSPMDREARVLRYREKKKTRKFEKTIRYASRKAYAETRPRIKGRFAKRTDTEVEVDQMFSNSVMADAGYGIVPSF